MRKIEADDQSLSSYLMIKSDIGVLNIPFSQRPYEWEKAQVVRLFNDLVSLRDNSDEIHMLNFFTLSREGDTTKVFDGQQRTVTSLLIVSSFARVLRELGEKEVSDYLIETYLIDKNPLKNTEDHKLIFENEDTNLLFYELIGIDDYKSKQSKNYSDITQKHLVSNNLLINELLDEYINNNNLNSEDIKDLISLILENTTLINIITYTDELAMAMFESLNNTGKMLENYYVLKNDLVLSLGEGEVKNKWNTVDTNLSTYDPSSFLLAVSTFLTGKSTHSNSLERIYSYSLNKENKEELSDFLNLLVESSEKYLYIRNPAQFVNYTPKEDLLTFKKLIDSVQMFIKSQHHPLLLSILIKEEPLASVNTVLYSLLNLGIRNFYFKENRANTIELAIANIAFKYYKGDMTINDVKDNIDSLSIKDDELREAIKAKKINKSSEKGFKFILRETYNLVDLNKETSITESLSGIHLEHILPQKPSQVSEWLSEFPDEEDREFYTRKIGNMTLLLGKINSRISNKDFIDKREQYSMSHIPENNQTIVLQEKWGKEEINSRTEQLADKIIVYLKSLI
ncbi:DUF262 domain-containing protein [Lactococcus garvieae]|uniref:DUF262 domain-containing protein n=1 Tax=Lactococcus garvieae DCC43 TaxID=1231377 RepID=K2NY54_9LACT|nr:DUF1524 domain-containing protein [Lactococcus garvieae]EKF52508.1 protein of unknown function DUF262 family [Lactococcus garvieae DCC43]